MALINALQTADFESAMEILKLGPDKTIDLEQLQVEVNRVHFTDKELATFWVELERVYPSVVEFWSYFDLSSEGFPLIPPRLSNAQASALYLGAIYYMQNDVAHYINTHYKLERTPNFNTWLEQCSYQACALNDSQQNIESV